jgi:hypothetical protein
MSRTIATMPPRVQLSRDVSRRKTDHDHRNGGCDLPTTKEWARLDTYSYGSCGYAPARGNRALAWSCDCPRCAYHGATPPRALRRRINKVMRRATARIPDVDLLDEIDDLASPRR